MPKLFPIIAFVGIGGVGKTTLIRELFKRHSNYISPLKSLTDREKRTPEDDIFYTYVDQAEILNKNALGEIIQYVEHNGNTYGSPRQDLEDVVTTRLGAQAFEEAGVINLIKAGYNVIPIKIVSSNHTEANNSEKALSEPQIEYALTVYNDFTDGGFEKSIQELEQFLHQTLANSISARIAEQQELE